MVDHSSASLFPSGRVRAWRERTGDLSQWTLYWCWQKGPQWQGWASKTCVRGRGPGHVNQHHSGCRFSGSILDTRERQEGKDKGKRWALFWKYVRTLLFLWVMSFFWALCAAAAWNVTNRPGSWERISQQYYFPNGNGHSWLLQCFSLKFD